MTIMDFLLAETRRLYDLAGEAHKAAFAARLAEYNRQHDAEMATWEKQKPELYRRLINAASGIDDDPPTSH